MSLEMRPRFHLELDQSRDELLERLRGRLACEGCPCKATVSDTCVVVEITPRLRHFWSPQLSFELSEEEGRTVLHGLFGPNPNVWTMVLAAYAALGFSGGFAALLGFSQRLIGQPAWGLWLAAAAAALMIVPYAASQIGQRLAAEQMELLRCFLDETIGRPHARVDSPACPPEPTGAGAEPRRLPIA